MWSKDTIEQSLTCAPLFGRTMGNSMAADVMPSNDENRKELNLSQQLSHKEFCKHLEGQCSSRSLATIPWHVLDSTWMYKRLLLSCNCLTALPPELPLRLPHLIYLDLDYNHLSNLPNSFSLFIHLRTLLLRYNNIEQLPASFVQLRKLQKLDISHNRLKELPDDIGDMPHLIKLNVAHNQLTALPPSLGKMKPHSVVLAQCNVCQVPPQELCDGSSSETLLAYLKTLLPTDGESKSSLLSDEVGLCNVFLRVRDNDATSSNINTHSMKFKYAQSQTQTTHTASRIKSPLMLPIGASTFSLTELGDKITGLIYGAVIGDALGVGTEFMSPDECKFHYDSKHLEYDAIILDEHTSHWRRGEWTSNSNQMFLVMDSVLHWAGMVDELDFAERLLYWKNHGYSDLDESEEYMLSETINEILKTKGYQEDPHTASQNLLRHSLENGTVAQNGEVKLPQGCRRRTREILFCDNGALPRAVILGVTHFYNLKEVISNSVRICLATHADERCVASSVALSVLIALLLQGRHKYRSKNEIKEIIQIVRNAAVQYLTNSDYVSEFDEYLSLEDYQSIQLHEKEKVHFTYKPLAAAIIALKSNKDIKTSLSDVILQGGHGSMNGCIAGAVLGCMTGFTRLPSTWVNGLLPNNVKWLNCKINSLLDKMGLP